MPLCARIRVAGSCYRVLARSVPVFDRNCKSSHRKFGSPQAVLPADSARLRAPRGGSGDRCSGRQALRVRTGLERRFDDTGRLLPDTSSELASVPALVVDHVPHLPWPALAFRAATRYQTTRRIADQPGPARAKGKCRDARARSSGPSAHGRGPPGDLPGPPAPGRDRLADGAPRPGRADSRSRRLRCALGHGRTAGRLGGR